MTAGINPVLTRTSALPFLLVVHLIREERPREVVTRLLAWIATLRLPVPTGVPKSVTGKLALTRRPALASVFAASAAAIGWLERITVFSWL